MTSQVQISRDDANIVPGITNEKKELLKRTLCANATNDEFDLFIYACDRYKLDPLMKQIYLVKYNGKVSIITGIDGYRLIAERTSKYMPGRETAYTYDKNGNLFSATSYVKKRASDGSWHECAATAIFSEYKASGPVWVSKPHVMIAKCSEALALRRAFPADLSGLYTEEEMEQVKAHAPILNISQCEKVDPVGTLTAANEIQGATVTASFKDVVEIQQTIENHITPVDPGYEKRTLNTFNVTSFSRLPADQVMRVRKNIEKKIAQLDAERKCS